MFATPLAERLTLLFAGPARPAFEALAALDHELKLAVRPGIDHGVAHTKLAWWHAEVLRLAAGKPEHPLSRALASAAGPSTDWRLLERRLEAAQLELGGFRPATLAELEGLVARSHGSPWQLAATLDPRVASPQLVADALALGKALGLAEWLAAPAGPPPLPDRTATEARASALLAGLDPASLQRAPLAVAAALASVRGAGAPRAFVQVFRAWRAARRALRTERHDD